MTAEIFIDTNILLYAQSKHPAEARKREVARECLQRPGIGFSTQVLGEFYVNATKKLEPPLGHDSALRILQKLEPFPIAPISPRDVYRALELKVRYQLSYWDSLIIAAAAGLGCRTVVSEDLSDGQVLEGIAVLNPFTQT